MYYTEINSFDGNPKVMFDNDELPVMFNTTSVSTGHICNRRNWDSNEYNSHICYGV